MSVHKIVSRLYDKETRMNVVVIIIDSLRQDHLGCYENKWIHTPYLDSLAKESVLFTNAYPESLPTLQVRRVLQTGCRIFPFEGHKAYKGQPFKGSPGWGPGSGDRKMIPTAQDPIHPKGRLKSIFLIVYGGKRREVDTNSQTLSANT